MDAADVSTTVTDMRHEVIETMVGIHVPPNAYAEQWDVAGLKQKVATTLNLDLPVDAWAAEEGIAEDDIYNRIMEAADKAFAEKAERFGPELMAYVERSVVLQTIDNLWREHIVNLDHLRSVVGFRGYAQRDPLQEYKAEAFELFQALLANLRDAVTMQMSRVELVRETPPAPTPPPMHGHHLDATTGEDDFAEGAQVAAAGSQPAGPEELGHRWPQRALPVRLRQEVQALPRSD